MAQTGQGGGQRAPHPAAEFRHHHETQQGELAAGASVAQSATAEALIQVFASSKARFRFKADRAGTLDFYYTRPPNSLARGETQTDAANYDDLPVAQQAVVASTELMVEVDDIRGESFIRVVYTEGGVGVATVDYLDVAQL